MSLEVKSINGSNLETVFFALCHLFFQPGGKVWLIRVPVVIH